uniref:ERBB receptor feedback inhibitor 1 n=1 Tax=Doryrhamphus excisus TaxID=161450 RepID=UPI0025AE5156|nr:ERBB receptor feedback inhibitor 1 [Doryrhamphus excisus]
MSHNNYWGQHDLSSVRLRLPGGDVEHNLTELQQQQMDRECNSSILTPQRPCYSDLYNLPLDKTLPPHEGDQVVPYSSTQRRTMFWDQQRESKPLPPLPDTEELMSDEAADSEVEFFTSERRPLLPKNCPKAVSRSRGRVNPAYRGGSLQPESGALAFSWPGGEDRQAFKGADAWPPIIYSKPPDCSPTVPPEKPQIPPRIPILPKTSKTTDPEDKPPKIPPRVPLVPPCPPRSPSPKSLPIYINGVMPATQSFATNPQYVSRALLSDRTPPAEQPSCIVPILKDGRQASTTHYILLPPRQRTDRRGRLLTEPARMGNQW